MLENLRASAAIVAPFLIYMLIGIMLRKAGILSEELAGRVNGLLFKVFFPVNIFNSMYKADISGIFGTLVAPYAMAGTLCVLFFMMRLARKLSPDPGVRAAIVHAGYRANVMLFALPIAQGVFGEDVTEILIILTVVMITNNFSSVPMMEHYSRQLKNAGGEEAGDQKTGFKELLIKLFKVPILDAVVIGFIWAIFRIPMPSLGKTVVSGIAGCVIPLAFMVMGARLDFAKIKANSRISFLVVFLRLVVIPAVFIAYPLIAGWDPRSLIALVTAFGSPSAIVSYTMCENYGCDGELAAEIVTISSTLALFTLFLWVFCFKQAGVLS